MSSISDPSHRHDAVAAFTPKLITAFHEGYSLAKLRADAVAGLTVAIVALPLAMAVAIASGVGPERGLYTAVVAGFLISALGGSRFQIGGPTAAFIVVVFDVIERHGYEGLALATLMAGVILVLVGALRLGTYIKYIPFPVVTGFTAGIAVSIAASQLKEVLGLESNLPADLVEKLAAIAVHIGETQPITVAVSIVCLAALIALRHYRPSWPNFLILVAGASAVVGLVGIDVATIGSRFGGVPSTLPAPALPQVDLALARAVIPDALTIALLAGIESLLSAVIADGMTGRRHRSNCELVAQGVANIASALFGGISATGAIARTATNIRSGARTPVAGMLHAVFLLVFMAVGASALSYVPLTALSAILLVVAWNISEFRHVREILGSAPVGDRFVLIGTFALTVGVDLTVGIVFGVVSAALLFMHRMAEAVEVVPHAIPVEGEEGDEAEEAFAETPDDVVVYRISGPFFFGAAQRIAAVMERSGARPRVFVLDLGAVPLVDTTAGVALKTFVANAAHDGAAVIIAGAARTVQADLERLGLAAPKVAFAPDVATALARTLSRKE